MKKRTGNVSTILWATSTTIMSTAIFLYWYLDYTKRNYSESVGFPLVFYRFQGGINGVVTDELVLSYLVVDSTIIIIGMMVSTWLILKAIRR
jgi:hypothetical protein